MKGVTDYRKSLNVIQDEWDGCTDCDLGHLRVLRGGRIVFGEGDPRPNGIMFISGDIGQMEEREDRILGGKAGRMFQRMLTELHISNFYITSLTSCRSCTPLLDEQNNPILTKGYPGRVPEPRYKDQPANRPQLLACSSRVHEEIYTVDPLLIVALGQHAASALRGRPFNMDKEHGYPEEIEVPGAGARAVFSAKRKEWVRKVQGQLVAPTERATVRYLMIPTLHPNDVQKKIMAEDKNNPYKQLSDDLYKVKHIWNSYHDELFGVIPDDMTDVKEALSDIADDFRDEEEDERNDGQ